MIISDKHRIAFIHIPKCAGSTLRHSLLELDERKQIYFERGRGDHPLLGFVDYAHLPLAVIRDHFPKDFALLATYRSFALMRDPMERFTSSLHEYMRWNTDKTLDSVEPEKAREIIDQIMKRLSEGGGKPVIDASLIHFSRQADYVELDGKRVISDIYPVESISDMLAEISRITGQNLQQKDRNQRITYTSPVIQSLSDRTQRALRFLLPAALTGPAFSAAKAAIMRAKLARPARKGGVAALDSDQFRDFVQEFYARDFTLHASLADDRKREAE